MLMSLHRRKPRPPGQSSLQSWALCPSGLGRGRKSVCSGPQTTSSLPAPQAPWLKWAQSLPCWPLCSVPKMCPALCNPMDYNSLPGSSVHGILQAGTLGWVAAPQTTQITEKRLEHHEGGSTQGYVFPCPLILPRTPDGPV